MDTDQAPVASAAPAATKPWWTSRTLWFNAIVAVLAVLETSTGLLQQALPANVYPAFALAVALINAALRTITRQGLGK